MEENQKPMKKLFVKRIIKKEQKRVYDIEMPSHHNFVLENGVVAHNCSHSTAYAIIAYASMYLKYHYPLDWWSAVLTNATEQEITGKFWPYVKDMVTAPDINLSSDVMVPDHLNNKIRSKLGVIRGMGDATLDPIVAGRPYKDIRDYVDKEVAGDSLTHKLIHVGVLDSLFPPRTNLLEKLKMYEDAVEAKAFADKSKKAKAEGRKIRALQPKPGKIPEEYIGLEKTPMKEAAMKKAVLPSLPIDLHALGKSHSRVLDTSMDLPMVLNSKNYKSLLVSGDKLKRIDELDGDSLNKDLYIASTCFIVKAEEFSFQNGTKRALKLILDVDGYVSEKVKWPSYDSGELEYPKELKRGVIATIFFKKRVGKKDVSMTDIFVES
jgi:DNA polymerase III alpha subunit